MNPPPGKPSPTKSFVPLMLAGILLTACLATLSLLTLGFAGVIVALALLLAAFIASQYLLWGWWLGKFIREREEAAEALKRTSSDTSVSRSTTTRDE